MIKIGYFFLILAFIYYLLFLFNIILLSKTFIFIRMFFIGISFITISVIKDKINNKEDKYYEDNIKQ